MLQRELKLLWAQRVEIIQYPLILVLLLMIFPLALDNSQMLQINVIQFAAAAWWVSVTFTVLLTINKTFHEDFQAGILEVYLVNNRLLDRYIGAKLLSQWIATIMPQLIILPLFFVFFNLDSALFWPVLFAWWLAVANFILLGAFISALLLSLQANGYLLILLLIPLYIPTLIFALGSFSSAWLSNLALLGGTCCLLLVICPFMVKIGLRISLS